MTNPSHSPSSARIPLHLEQLECHFQEFASAVQRGEHTHAQAVRAARPERNP